MIGNAVARKQGCRSAVMVILFVFLTGHNGGGGR
jgi:hypothetical protein